MGTSPSCPPRARTRSPSERELRPQRVASDDQVAVGVISLFGALGSWLSCPLPQGRYTHTRVGNRGAAASSMGRHPVHIEEDGARESVSEGRRWKRDEREGKMMQTARALLLGETARRRAAWAWEERVAWLRRARWPWWLSGTRGVGEGRGRPRWMSAGGGACARDFWHCLRVHPSHKAKSNAPLVVTILMCTLWALSNWPTMRWPSVTSSPCRGMRA